MSKRGKYLVIAAVALALGGACYVFFREDTYLFGWASDLLKAVFAKGRERTFQNEFLQFYLPDLLWGLSLSVALMAIYEPSGIGAWLCAGTAVVCGWIWELAQWTGAVRGTGDFGDVFMYLLAGFFSLIINKKVRETK